MNDILKSLYERKSVRAYTDEDITNEQRAAILKAAFSAPTAGNQQLYTIIDVTDQNKKETLSRLCENQRDIAESKMCFVFLADCRKYRLAYTYAGCKPRPTGIGDFMLASADALLAAMNAVTAADSMGIGSCFIGHIGENAEKVRELLELPSLVIPVAMAIFGKPTEQQLQRKKPARFDEAALLRKNVYSDRTEAQMRDDFAARAERGGKSDFDYDAKLKAMHKKQFDCAYTRELTRSASVYFFDFEFDGLTQAASAEQRK